MYLYIGDILTSRQHEHKPKPHAHAMEGGAGGARRGVIVPPSRLHRPHPVAPPRDARRQSLGWSFYLHQTHRVEEVRRTTCS